MPPQGQSGSVISGRAPSSIAPVALAKNSALFKLGEAKRNSFEISIRRPSEERSARRCISRPGRETLFDLKKVSPRQDDARIGIFEGITMQLKEPGAAMSSFVACVWSKFSARTRTADAAKPSTSIPSYTVLRFRRQCRVILRIPGHRGGLDSRVKRALSYPAQAAHSWTMPGRVLLSSDGERIQVSEKFFQSCSTLVSADFAGTVAGTDKGAEPEDFPVPFSARDLRTAVSAFDESYVIREDNAMFFLRLADYFGCPVLAVVASRPIQSQWMDLFLGGSVNADAIMEILDSGVFLPHPRRTQRVHRIPKSS